MTVEPHANREELFVHARNYHHFMLVVKWFAIHFAALASFLTLWFATSAGFGWGLAVGLAVWLIGVYAMRRGLAHSSDDETTQRV